MVKTGDWLIPRMDYLIHLDKPPLSNWLVAASFKILGPSEFSARLPNVLISLILLIGTLLLGRFLFDFQTGLSSAWILLTSGLYLAVSRLVIPDMALSLWIFVAAACSANLFFGSRYRVLSLYGGALALGMGMLTKGPVAWLIVLLPSVIFAIWKRRGVEISWIHWLVAALLMLGISFSWYILVTIQRPGTFDYFLRYQLLGRMFKGTTGHRHPFYYYLIVLPLGFLPWILFMPQAFAWQLKRAQSSKQERDRIHFLLLWFLIPLVLLSLFKTKLATYIVPLYPPLALLMGRFWSAVSSKAIPFTRSAIASSWLLILAYPGIMIGILILIWILPELIRGIPLSAIFLGGGIFLTSAVVMARILVQRKFEWFFPAQVGILAFVALATFTFLPLIQYKNAKIFADKILELKRPEDRVILYRRYFASLPFYLGQRVLCAGLPADMAPFDMQEVSGKYFFPGQDSIRPLVEDKGRVFVLTDDDGFRKAEFFSRIPLYPILKAQKAVLFSNQPVERKA